MSAGSRRFWLHLVHLNSFCGRFSSELLLYNFLDMHVPVSLMNKSPNILMVVSLKFRLV